MKAIGRKVKVAMKKSRIVLIGVVLSAASRLGSPAATTRGFGVEEFREVGLMIDEVLEAFGHADNGAMEAAVGARVQAMCARFPIYQGR